MYLCGRYLVLQQENYDINEEKVDYNKVRCNLQGSAQLVIANMDVAYLEAWIAIDPNHFAAAAEAVTVTEAAGDALVSDLEFPKYWAVRL